MSGKMVSSRGWTLQYTRCSWRGEDACFHKLLFYGAEWFVEEKRCLVTPIGSCCLRQQLWGDLTEINDQLFHIYVFLYVLLPPVIFFHYGIFIFPFGISIDGEVERCPIKRRVANITGLLGYWSFYFIWKALNYGSVVDYLIFWVVITYHCSLCIIQISLFVSLLSFWDF